MERFIGKAKNFCVALNREINARGRGTQKKLAEETGISPGLISSLKEGHTLGSPETRKKLAIALGFKNCNELVKKWRKLEPKEVGFNSTTEFNDDDERDEKFDLAQKLITIQEDVIASQKKSIMSLEDQVMSLRLEIESLRENAQVAEAE